MSSGNGSTVVESFNDYDDAIFEAMQQALSNVALPVTARSKVRMADMLTAEAMAMLRAEMARVKGVPRVGGPARVRRSRAKKKPDQPAA